jgi:hypothetical protein
MKLFPRASFAVFLLTLATLPALGQTSINFQLNTVGQPICTLSKYAKTIACVPSVAANYGAIDWVGNINSSGQFVPATNKAVLTSAISLPFGLGYQYASQIATSPSAATSVGYVFTFEKGALSAKPADLGPLLSDIPQTIGKNKFYIGASYQWMEFSKSGGQSMSSFMYPGGFIDARNKWGYNYNQATASLKMNNINTYISYGITNRLEISAVVPWSQAELNFQTSCAPTSYGVTSGWTYTSSGGQTENLCGATGEPWAVYDLNGTPVGINGYQEYDVSFMMPNTQDQKASGMDDVTLRAKYEILKKSHQGLALGVEYRLPTGDPLNLKGSGATGVRPFLAWSYNGRISPHANIGYQYNGKSVNDVFDTASLESVEKCTTTGTLANCSQITTINYSDILAATKLPNIITFSGGADFALSKRINLDADFLERSMSNDGSRVWAQEVGSSSEHVSYAENYVTKSNFFNGSKDKTTIVLGAKGKLASHLLLGASVMIDASNNGLSYKPSPIATLSYDFGGEKK